MPTPHRPPQPHETLHQSPRLLSTLFLEAPKHRGYRLISPQLQLVLQLRQVSWVLLVQEPPRLCLMQ